MINLYTKGLSNAINDLLGYANSLEDRMHELLERLMNEGWEIASYGFANALYAGHKDVQLDIPTWEGKRLVLNAHGETVAFIEFGSGVTYEEYPPDAKPESILSHGQYGKGQGATGDPWIYVGETGDLGYAIGKKKDGRMVVKTKGNPPARAMYEASKVLDKDHIVEVAKEVFG